MTKKSPNEPRLRHCNLMASGVLITQEAAGLKHRKSVSPNTGIGFWTKRDRVLVFRRDQVFWSELHSVEGACRSCEPWAPIDLSLDTEYCLKAVKHQLFEAHKFMEAVEAVSTDESGRAFVAAANEVAPDFFHLCQVSLIQSAAMAVAKVTEKASVGNYETTTLARLTELVESDGLAGAEMRSLRSALDAVEGVGKGLRRARDKFLAHSDASEFEDGKRVGTTFSWEDITATYEASIRYVQVFENATRRRHWRPYEDMMSRLEVARLTTALQGHLMEEE